MAKNPESIITTQIRNMLSILKLPHWKNWGGPMGERGVPDIIGCIPGGKMLLIEVKTPTGVLSPEQGAFLDRFRAAGALAFVARSPEDVVAELAAAGYEPAIRVVAQFAYRRRI